MFDWSFYFVIYIYMKRLFLFTILFLSFIGISHWESCNEYWSALTYVEKTELWNNALAAYNNWKYEDAIKFRINYLKEYNNQNESVKINCKDRYMPALNNLKLAYIALSQQYYEKEQWDDSIKYLWKALEIDPNDYEINLGLWLSFYNKWDSYNALNYYKEALKYASNKKDREDILTSIQFIESEIKYQSEIKNAVTNDKYLFFQYYLRDLNITNAWKNVTKTNQVVVAVIDDGININHPDLLNSIWTSPNAKYGASKIIDFVWDWMPANLPVWEHGTMIAWIIWATQNNNEWIAWIAKNVKIMPLRVFWTWGTAEEWNIVKAIDYAINNGANIINLSLWWSQFSYSEKYDEVIKRAYDKWIIVVIAAWNWDVLSGQEIWINLTNNPISPVCNNWWKYNKYSIGVMATDKTWTKTPRTNYWDCIPFMAPWVWIIWTSIPVYNSTYGSNYNILDWTSFSAPIISWIVALWYNQYGFVSPTLVYESLKSSLTKNSAWNDYVDAVKYLDILWTKITQIKQEQVVNTWTLASTNTNLSSNIQTTTPKTSLSNWDILAAAGIVKKQDSEDLYRTDDFVLRQEVIWMTIKLWGFSLPDSYSCKWYFSDVSTIKPNNWACRAIEISADNSIITKANAKFRPEDRITKIEALAILLKWAKIEVPQSTSSNFSDVGIPWQVNIVNTALNKKIIDQWSYFFPNQNATRWEIFEMAKRILNLNK